jgi:uncharacterized membrane protein
VFESLFSFLFKYPRMVFEQGQFVFGATGSMRLAVLLAAAAGLYVVWTYRRLANLPGRDRAVLLSTRIGVVLLLLFCLMRPQLHNKVAVPQQNFVAVMLDDSKSMLVADQHGAPRADYIRNDIARVDSPLLTALNKRFQIRVFRFSGSADRLMNTGDLQFGGTSTRLGEALDRVRDEMSGLPVAGVVMVTDGGDNSQASLDEPIESLKASAMPVFTVGVGEESLTRDVQVTRAEVPRRALKGSALVVDVVVTQTGYAGAKVPLIVEDGGRMVSTQDITLPANGESSTVKVRFKAFEAGPRVYRFRIPLQANEEVSQNNARDRLVEVVDRREAILYLEGEPRSEPKFVRLATQADDNLRIALLQRTAMATSSVPDKFYRIGMETQEELQEGFPATREELFKYRGIILGSVEASAFSPEQQRMLEDFVDIRGGGLLMLGGPRSFSEGGWGGTPLSNALPVVIERGSRNPTVPPIEIIAKPTPAGASHSATQIADTAEATAAKWNELPALTSVNNVVEVKPGATVLLNGLPNRGSDQVVLAWQRYGRGKALALPVQDTWMWRMHVKMDVKDETHFTFWRRLARWLVDGVPDRVMVASRPEQLQRGEPLTISADVFDAEFKGVNDGRITAHVTAPSGKVTDVPMEWTVEQEGEYAARFTPSEDGVHRIVVDGASKGGKDLTRGTSYFLVAPSEAEFFDAAMHAPVLRRIANDTGGRFFRADDTSKLVDAITYSGKGITVVEENELWDMPINLFLALGLMGAEWMFRRKRGLA